MFSHAICRQPGPDFALGLTTAALGKPDYALMLEQHGAYVQALRDQGLSVEVLEPLEGFPDACFVEDAAIITDEVAVVTRPGAHSRRGEERALAPVLAKHRPLAHIQAPGTLDGGDVLIVGRSVFIGLSERTNPEGAEQLGEIFAAHGYKWDAVPLATGLHLKSSLSWLGGNTLLVGEDFADLDELKDFQRIVVYGDEAYACNTLWINGTLLTPKGFPKTLAKLKSLGRPILELDTSEARKMDGGLTCLSLRF